MPEQAAYTDVTNPGTGEVLGRLPLMTAAEVDAVVANAAAGQAAMAALPAHARADLLLNVAARIEAERDSLAALLAAKNGKPIEQTEGEVDAAVRIFRGSAGEATRLFGTQYPLRPLPRLGRH